MAIDLITCCRTAAAAYRANAEPHIGNTVNLSARDVMSCAALLDEVAWEIERLRMERDGLRLKVRARDLLDQQLVEEMAEMQRAFSSRGEHGGSPGEWSYERMDEIATEQQRRTTTATSGGDHG